MQVRPKMFIVVCRGKRDFEIGKRLRLRDDIEECDYIDLTKNLDIPNKRFLEDMKDVADFHLPKIENDTINDYHENYLVITTSQYVVIGAIRI